MNISFDCRAFENYELQKFYSTLQALALDEPDIEPIEDTLQPCTEGLEQVLNGLDEEFRKAIFGKSGGRTGDNVVKYAKGSRNNKNKSSSKSNDSKSSKSNSKKKKKKEKSDEDDEGEIEGGNDYSDEIIKKKKRKKRKKKKKKKI